MGKNECRLKGEGEGEGEGGRGREREGEREREEKSNDVIGVFKLGVGSTPNCLCYKSIAYHTFS